MITIIAQKTLFRQPQFTFATAAEIAQKTFSKFQKKYSQSSDGFKAKMDELNKRHSEVVRPTVQKAFVHPYDQPHNPLTFSHGKIFELHNDFVGPEQVSPHYENFLMSRKSAVTFWVGAFGLTFAMSTIDLHWFARSMFFPWLVYFSYLYFFLEARKSLMKPLLSRFYRRIMLLEMNNLSTYYHENIEASVRALMAHAKHQLSYKIVHNDYTSVRNDSIMNFLVNEQISLQNHISHRALNILKQAEAIEEVNQRKIMDKVVADAVNSLEEAYKNNKEKIEKDIFEIALEGLTKGQMDYAKDPILPFIIESINKNVTNFQQLTKEQQNTMISLTQEQVQQIRNTDVRAKEEYLHTEPKIDGSLKTNPVVAKILANWSK